MMHHRLNLEKEYEVESSLVGSQAKSDTILASSSSIHPSKVETMTDPPEWEFSVACCRLYRCKRERERERGREGGRESRSVKKQKWPKN